MAKCSKCGFDPLEYLAIHSEEEIDALMDRHRSHCTDKELFFTQECCTATAITSGAVMTAAAAGAKARQGGTLGNTTRQQRAERWQAGVRAVSDAHEALSAEQLMRQKLYGDHGELWPEKKKANEGKEVPSRSRATVLQYLERYRATRRRQLSDSGSTERSGLKSPK
jgi:hypothetical protein